MIIRKIEASDADQFLKLCKQLDVESKFMMLEPQERNTTVAQQEEAIKNMYKDGLSVIFVCEIDGKIVGHLTANRENYTRMKHSAYIVIGILKNFTGKGIGTQLFKELEIWASQHRIHRLELTVMCHNTPGIALYKKMGFEIEGVKKHSLKVDQQFIDEYYMAKLL